MPYIGRGSDFGVRSRFIYTATAGQTTFSGNDDAGISLAYTDTLYMDVYQNGVLLVPATDYAASTGTSVVLVQGASVGDTVELLVHDIFSVADSVSAKDGGSFAGNVGMGGTLSVTGKITADAGIDIDNFNIDGTTIALSSGTMILDSAGDIVLDCDGTAVLLKDAGTEFGRIFNASSDLVIKSIVSDKDMKFQGNDGGATVNALVLDMSDAGTATFNHDVLMGDTCELKLGADGDLKLFHDGSANYIRSQTSDMDLSIVVNDGGNIITALAFDSSAAGAATFNSSVTENSDERLKSNITTIPDALSKVTEMRGVHYIRKDTGLKRTGLIAQELQKIAPELVSTAEDEMSTLSVSYANVVGYLIEAVKELSEKNDALESRLAALEAK